MFELFNNMKRVCCFSSIHVLNIKKLDCLTTLSTEKTQQKSKARRQFFEREFIDWRLRAQEVKNRFHLPHRMIFWEGRAKLENSFHKTFNQRQLAKCNDKVFKIAK